MQKGVSSIRPTPKNEKISLFLGRKRKKKKKEYSKANLLCHRDFNTHCSTVAVFSLQLTPTCLALAGHQLFPAEGRGGSLPLAPRAAPRISLQCLMHTEEAASTAEQRQSPADRGAKTALGKEQHSTAPNTTVHQSTLVINLELL